jgi:hypothetical protein
VRRQGPDVQEERAGAGPAPGGVPRAGIRRRLEEGVRARGRHHDAVGRDRKPLDERAPDVLRRDEDPPGLPDGEGKVDAQGEIGDAQTRTPPVLPGQHQVDVVDGHDARTGPQPGQEEAQRVEDVDAVLPQPHGQVQVQAQQRQRRVRHAQADAAIADLEEGIPPAVTRAEVQDVLVVLIDPQQALHQVGGVPAGSRPAHGRQAGVDSDSHRSDAVAEGGAPLPALS